MSDSELQNTNSSNITCHSTPDTDDTTTTTNATTTTTNSVDINELQSTTNDDDDDDDDDDDSDVDSSVILSDVSNSSYLSFIFSTSSDDSRSTNHVNNSDITVDSLSSGDSLSGNGSRNNNGSIIPDNLMSGMAVMTYRDTFDDDDDDSSSSSGDDLLIALLPNSDSDDSDDDGLSSVSSSSSSSTEALIGNGGREGVMDDLRRQWVRFSPVGTRDGSSFKASLPNDGTTVETNEMDAPHDGRPTNDERRHRTNVDNNPDDEKKTTTNDCCICLAPYESGDCAIRLPCGHVYHEECVLRWTAHHVRCPLCNFDLQKGDYERGSGSDDDDDDDGDDDSILLLSSVSSGSATVEI